MKKSLLVALLILVVSVSAFANSVSFDTVDEYCQKLMKIYRGE